MLDGADLDEVLGVEDNSWPSTSISSTSALRGAVVSSIISMKVQSPNSKLKMSKNNQISLNNSSFENDIP